MPIFYYFILIVLVLITALYIFIYIMDKRNTPGQLFTEALRDENSGHFEEAVTTYESALDKEKRSIFHSNRLKNMIIEKLKVLHTNIEYKKGLRNTR